MDSVTSTVQLQLYYGQHCENCQAQLKDTFVSEEND